jgi:hypothetical protein
VFTRLHYLARLSELPGRANDQGFLLTKGNKLFKSSHSLRLALPWPINPTTENEESVFFSLGPLEIELLADNDSSHRPPEIVRNPLGLDGVSANGNRIELGSIFSPRALS